MKDPMEQKYEDMLDECYGTFKVGCCEFSASQVMKECDPIAYDVGFADFSASEEEEEEEATCGECGRPVELDEVGICADCGTKPPYKAD